MGKTARDANSQSWKDRINFNTVAALFLIVFSIAAFLLIPYQIEKPKFFMGRSLMYMTPSVFPRLSIVGLFILSLWYLTHSFQLREKNRFKELEGKHTIRVLVTFTVFVAYALLLEPLGFVVSSALMISFLMFYYRNRNLPLFFAVLISAPLVIYFLFTRVLKVSLPEGILF